MTALVPSTAGFIISSSCFGAANGKGEAVWTTKSIPLMASLRDYSFNKSASTRVIEFFSICSRSGPIFF